MIIVCLTLAEGKCIFGKPYVGVIVVRRILYGLFFCLFDELQCGGGRNCCNKPLYEVRQCFYCAVLTCDQLVFIYSLQNVETVCCLYKKY